MTTLSDIAKKAGCSVNLVSYVLKKTEPPTKEKHKRILQIAEELNYVPNHAASALITGRTNNIILVSNDLHTDLYEPFFAEFLNALTEKFTAKGIGLTLYCSMQNEKNIKKVLLNSSSDGVIWYHCQIPNEVKKFIQKQGFPSINILSREEQFSYLAIDDHQSEYELIARLYDLGHRNILFCGDTGGPRYEAYCRFVQEHGLSFCRDIPRSDYDFKNRDSMQKYILEHGRDFTAIVCERDMVAVSMLYVLQNLGIEVPGQVSVVGYDDLPMASQCKPSLTTVHHNYLEIAHQTVQYFVSRLSGKQTEEPLQKTYIHPIIARESDGPVPR